MARRYTQMDVIIAILILTFSVLTPKFAQAYWFSPPQCDFAVRFPAEPSIKLITTSEIAALEAEIMNDNGLIRAVCMGQMQSELNEDIPYFDDPALTMATIKSFAEQNGLSNAAYTYERTDIGFRAGMRGTKKLEGHWFTYESLWYISESSVMSLTSGHLSANYPSGMIFSFFDSITRK